MCAPEPSTRAADAATNVGHFTKARRALPPRDRRPQRHHDEGRSRALPAKSESRNQFHFHVAELDEETRERIMITEDLRHAVERGKFELHYQPQVELDTGRLSACRR